MQMVQI